MTQLKRIRCLKNYIKCLKNEYGTNGYGLFRGNGKFGTI